MGTTDRNAETGEIAKFQVVEKAATRDLSRISAVLGLGTGGHSPTEQEGAEEPPLELR